LINNWAQQGGDFRICLTFQLTTGEAACDAGDEVGDLYAWSRRESLSRTSANWRAGMT